MVVKVDINHHRTFIKESTDEELRIIRKALKVNFIRRNKQGIPVFEKSEDLFIREDHSFPTGFLNALDKKLSKKNIDIEATDYRNYPPPYKSLKLRKVLDDPRNFQASVKEKLASEYVGYVSAPTGSGKSRLIIDMILDKRVSTLVIVPSESIRRGLVNKFSELFGSGKVSENISDARKKVKPITAMCYHSLPKLDQDILNQFQMVIIDEFDTASNNTIRSALLKMPNAAYRYFVSATPWRDRWGDMQLLKSAAGENCIFELSPTDAFKEEIIAKPELIIINCETPLNFLKYKQWIKAYEMGIVNNKTRNAQIASLVKKDFDQGRNIIVFVNRYEHIDNLKEEFDLLGIPVQTVTGQTSKEDRIERESIAANATYGVVTIATDALTRGTDLVNVNTVYLAGGTKGSNKMLQKIGRGARRSESTFKVYDFNDWFNPILSKHFFERQKVFKKYFGI